MKNKITYYILQGLVGIFSVFTFVTFTLPYLSSVSLEPKPADNSLSRSLSDTKVPDNRTGSYGPGKITLPKKNNSFDSSWSTPPTDSSWESRRGSAIDSTVHKRVETKPEVEVSNYYTVKEFFSFTSSVCGSVFPIVGIIVTLVLWKKQRKLESA